MGGTHGGGTEGLKLIHGLLKEIVQTQKVWRVINLGGFWYGAHLKANLFSSGIPTKFVGI